MNPTQPQQSTSKFHQLHCQKIQFLAAKVPSLSEDTEATQVSGSKGAITGKKAEVPATLARNTHG